MDGDPTPGVVESVQALAREFGDFAHDVEAAYRSLNAFGSDTAAMQWVGQTADSFKNQYGPLPGRLQKLYTSYSEASDALSAYAPALQAAQSKADAALRQAQDANADLQRATTNANSAAADLKTAQQNHAASPNPQAVTDAQTAHDTAQTNLTNAKATMAALTKQANDAYHDRITAAQACARAIGHAQSDGIHNKHWWEHLGADLAEWGGKIAEIANDLAPILDVLALATSWIPGVDVITAGLAEADNLIALAGTGLEIAGDAMQGHWGDALMGAGMLGLTFLGGKAIEKFGGAALERIGARANKEALTAGDPVDVVSGQMLLKGDTDLFLPGVLPLVVGRSYASAYSAGRLFGPGWASFLDQRVSVNAAGIHFAGEDCQVLDFPIPVGAEPVHTARGELLSLTWDRENDEIRIESVRGGTTWHFGVVHHREEAGQIRDLTALSDRNGNRIEILRTADGIPTGIEHYGGYRVAIDVGPTAGGPRLTGIRLLDATEGSVLVREFGYDEAGRLTEMVDASATAFRYVYDDADRITAWIDRNGVTYRYEYDEAGRVVRGSNPEGLLAAAFAYDDEARTTVVTDSLGFRTTYRHDENGHPDLITDALGGVREIRSDPRGHLMRQVDQLGQVTEFVRDDRGNELGVNRSDGTRVRAAYNAFDRPVELTAPDGAVWRYEYDARGRLIAVTDPLGAVSGFRYDERGFLTRSSDALGASQRHVCDAAGLPVEVVDPTGGVVRCRRDAFGRIVEYVDPLGAVTTIERDALGRPVRETAPDGTTQRWEYDPEGNLVAYTTPAGAVTVFEYGPFDKVTARTDPDGGRYLFGYDSELRLATVTGPTGLTWRYEHDAVGNLVGETSFDGVGLAYRLDAAGRLVARTGPDGTDVTFVRDGQGRVVERYAGGDVFRYAYDEAGRLRAATGAGSTISYERDALGRVTAETVDGRTLVNVYDAVGQRTERTTPGGVTTRWSYDASGRHQSATGTAGALEFRYDAAGRETLRLLGPGASLSQTYDSVGRPLVQGIWSHPGQDPAAAARAAEPVSLQSRSVSYRADGLPVEARDALRGTTVYQLDLSGRVTAVEAASWRETYAYDALGNLSLAQTPQLQDQDRDEPASRERTHTGTRIDRDHRTTYEYDDAGQLVRKIRRTLSGGRRIWTYSWDADGRLTGFTGPDGDTWSYSYDPLDRRTAKTRIAADGTVADTVRFSWDGPRVAEELRIAPDGRSTTVTWDYEPRGFKPVAQTRRSWAADAPQEEIDEEFHAIVTDAVGTPMELVTSDGRLAWYTTRSLYGRRIVAPESTTDCPLGFPGQYRDDESGLYYNVHRYYDPETAAYLSPDPLGFAPADNNTAYVTNPLVESDPLGLFSCPIAVGKELEGMRGGMGMKTVDEEDAIAAPYLAAGKNPPPGTLNTLGKMEFDGGREPVYGINGRLAERTDAYPGKGNSLMPQSYVDHAEGDMAYQASQRGYSGGNAAIYTDRNQCGFCNRSIKGYVKLLNLDSITVYDPRGLVGVWDATGKIA
ncbi:RHS repeat-associated core domain-containing protein [Catenulispora sp. EB89]|uniref:RHS repeat-associated core domain-containing protein n=1 Tax=Catenulispora sp. EB89 TaxID=3156257 RepID=UPI00351537A9